MGGKVDIGKMVDYKTLENALLKAAGEVGWKAKVRDQLEKDYRLGSVEDVESYSYTLVELRCGIGGLFRAMQVYIRDKDLPTDTFHVWTGIPHGWASEEKVRKYLDAVSRNLLS